MRNTGSGSTDRPAFKDKLFMESETHGNRDSETRGAPIDFGAVLLSVARYWKLIAATTAFTLAASYGVLRFVPSPYKSTVEILVYDPQRQIDSAIQKPISPFLDPMGYDAMNTEIGILKSKSVALRVAGELHLDEDPEFQGGSGLAEILHRAGVKEVLDRIDLPRWIKPSHPAGPDSALPTKAEKLDQAAEILAGRIQAWAESYIISISVTAQSPAMAARVTTAIAETYLRSQRDARQQALEQVADWLKSRVDGLRSRIVEAETEITKLSAENDIMDTDTSNVREKQIAALNSQLMAAREQVAERGAHLAQARRVVDSNGDLQSISELTASGTLSKLRQEETQLNLRVQDLTNRVGPRHSQVVAARTALAVVRQQISAEGEHILGNMQNAYDIAVQQQQSIMLALRALTTHVNPEALRALRNLRRGGSDTPRKLPLAVQ
jgi:succinoglycan biosynthesis transport protein ExoP